MNYRISAALETSVSSTLAARDGTSSIHEHYRHLRWLLVLWCALTGPSFANGAALPPLAYEPTLSAVRVPMRDGVTLTTHIWLPSSGKRHPTVLLRNPYGLRYGPGADIFKTLGLNRYVERGYAVVIQDTRGTGGSEGSFSLFFDDAKDGYDTIEWIARQSWSNGRVAMDGVSYLGTVQWLAARERPPHLNCIIPTAPAGLPFEELPYLGGALRIQWALPYLALVLGLDTTHVDWPTVFKHRPLNTADTLLKSQLAEYRNWLEHPTLDEYWRRIQLDAADFRKIRTPFLTVSGWYDDELRGTLHYWSGMQEAGGPEGFLIIGPWDHLQTYLGGAEQFGLMSFSSESMMDLQQERMAFLDHCLKNQSQRASPPRVRVYITGSNEWRSFERYPPQRVQPTAFYLRGEGGLSPELPGDESSDSFTFDPTNPAPSVSAAVDAKELEGRNDILVYTSEALREPLTLLGPVEAVLYASTDGKDTDWVVRLLDVRPDGIAVVLNHSGGVLRARYREGFERERLLTPGAVERFKISVWHLGHTILPGHRLRVHVTSSAYPLIAPNQNTGRPAATDTQWRTARQTIYHDRARASHVVLPVLKP